MRYMDVANRLVASPALPIDTKTAFLTFFLSMYVYVYIFFICFAPYTNTNSRYEYEYEYTNRCEYDY